MNLYSECTTSNHELTITALVNHVNGVFCTDEVAQSMLVMHITSNADLDNKFRKDLLTRIVESVHNVCSVSKKFTVDSVTGSVDLLIDKYLHISMQKFKDGMGINPSDFLNVEECEGIKLIPKMNDLESYVEETTQPFIRFKRSEQTVEAYMDCVDTLTLERINKLATSNQELKGTGDVEFYVFRDNNSSKPVMSGKVHAEA